MTTPNDEQLVGTLIDLSPEVDNSDSKSSNSVEVDRRSSGASISSPDSVFTPSQPNRHVQKGYSRLCGYLNKLGNRTILKTYKKRWFVFSENNCKLFYYRSPQDHEPLGEIDISQATFSFDVENKERTGLFTISLKTGTFPPSVPGKDYFLEANNRQSCLFWLQELQKYRRAYSLQRIKHISDESSNGRELRARPQSGLLADLSNQIHLEDSKDVPLMVPVDCPTDVIGDASALNSSSAFSTAQQKFSSFYNQVKHTAQFTKTDKSPTDVNSNTSMKEDTIQEESSSSSKVASPENDAVQFRPSKPTSLSSFKNKLSHSFRKSRPSEEDSEASATPGKENCQQCRRMKYRIGDLEEEVSNLRDENMASQEVRLLLQRQLDIASKEKETLGQIYQIKDHDQLAKLVIEKDQKIVNLIHDVQEQMQDVEKLQRQVQVLQAEIADLTANNELFQEMLKQKDGTIINLTNELFDMETERVDTSREGSVSVVPEPTVESKDSLTYDELKDSVQAFELQNKFLNNELLELNQLRRDGDERVKLLSTKSSEWEARSYQIQSKLLFLLNELSKNNGSFNQDIVSQLLEEAVGDGTAHTSMLPAWSRDKIYDELGFNWRWGKDDVLSLKASNLRQKSEDITNKAKDLEHVSWRTKWDNYFVSVGSKELVKSPELKGLVRSGIPPEYRGKVWKGCVYRWVKDYKSLMGTDYYNHLLTAEDFVGRLDPSSKQIELDLLRTLPNNRHYEHLDSDGVPKLRRVLLAYSRHDPVVGYCQGLNRLAAIALLFMEEEDAFWCLVAIIKFIMPDGYYTRTLITAHLDQKVLKELLLEKMPKLHGHLEQNNVDLSLFTFNWFLTIFVDNVPVNIYLRIWDAFLYEGSKVLFRYALAFFKLCETEILQVKDYLGLNKYLRSIAETCTDVKKLTHIAFNELNPFSQRMINSKRTHHFSIIRDQLEEFENQRKSQKSSSKETPGSFDYMSEDD